jgi:hypothetical protein
MAIEDKNLRRVSVGIDSSNNIRYSMVVAGPEQDVADFYERMCSLFKKCGVKVMHYTDIDKKIIKALLDQFDIFNGKNQYLVNLLAKIFFERNFSFAVSGINVFPSAAIIFRSGSNVLNIEVTSVSSPLKTDRIIISAIVPTVTPATDTAEIMFMAFRDFFAKRYLFAM